MKDTSEKIYLLFSKKADFESIMKKFFLQSTLVLF